MKGLLPSATRFPGSRNNAQWTLMLFISVILLTDGASPFWRRLVPQVWHKGITRTVPLVVTAASTLKDEDATDSCDGSEQEISSVCFLRGGSLVPAFSPVDDAIHSFLERSADLAKENQFHVQGWRWHTLSLVRDCRRLERLARLTDTPVSYISAAAHHVIDFNMNGLHRIEEDLFFPWLDQRLCGSKQHDKKLAGAFRKVLTELNSERSQVAKLGKLLKQEAVIASDPKVSAMKLKEALGNIVKLAALLSEKTQATYNREDRLLVPVVAAVVPESEQKSFNSKVIRKLGILDSRIHLVGMYDAVWEDAPLSERDEFEKAIPYIPRKMIPRWRRNLYEPQAGMLNV
eukprot:scaffold44817_cov46-Attheya_sp.AAC.3